jgi:fused signal recognition particle receptor
VNAQGKGWAARLRSGLGRSRGALRDGINGLFAKGGIDQASLDELEDILITADLGVATAARLVGLLSEKRFAKDITPDEVCQAMAGEIAAILEPVARPLEIARDDGPHVVLVCGVNGSGKTTTIGKLAGHFGRQGRKVMLCAGDTFRAAAIEQLQVWGERAGCPVIAGAPGADAAGLAFESLEKARAEGVDLLCIDTAGRLHNRAELMAELEKIARVLGKLDERAPHSRLLVLDATVGQNGHAQVEAFSRMINISGLVLTKLDGTAKGGVLVALAEKFGLPVHALGVGEGMEDLQPFEADGFARSLLGLGD